MKSLASAYVNLLKTCIGSGVLNFPMLCKTYGLITVIILTFLNGFMAVRSLILLVICSEETGRSSDLSKLAKITIPHARIFVDMAVFLKCFGVCISYLVITVKLLPSIFESIVNVETVKVYPSLLLLAFMLFTGPLCYLKKMDKLKYTSFMGLTAIIFVIIASIWRYYNTIPSFDTSEIVYTVTTPNIKWISSLGRFIFSFTCHQNIFQVYSELENNSLGNMKKLIGAVAISSFFLYTLFGGYNYLLFGENTRNNVLTNLPSDNLSLIIKSLYVLVLGVSYPLQMTPAKSYFMNIFGVKKSSSNYSILSFIVLSILILISYLVGISNIDLGLIYGIVGATASTFMCLILPPLFYINMDIEKTLSLTIQSYILFLYGVFVFLSTIITIVLGL